MSDLEKLQAAFRVSLHNRQMADELAGQITSDDIAPASRMQVYQNNYRATLVDLILQVFPIASAFVGEDFLRAAAGHFLDEEPPVSAALENYGASFPDFLSHYSHADDVPYLADIAAMEWAVYELQHIKTLADYIAADEEMDIETISISGAEIICNPDLRIIQSDYPLLQLWMVGAGQLLPEAVHIGAGAQNVGVYVDGFEIKMNSISAAELELLTYLMHGSASEFNTKKLKVSDEIVVSLFEKNLLVNLN